MKKKELQELFRLTFGTQADSMERLPGAGSQRRYFRMKGGAKHCIGVYSPDPLETRAFIEFTRHFLSHDLNVPELLAKDAEKGIYLLADLGDVTLREKVDRSRLDSRFPETIIPLYRNVLEHLIRFQLDGHNGLDYSVCVPRKEFDRQSVMWDLNHFKYYFLKLLGIPFDEQELENDFESFAGFLSAANSNHFLYRDFQSRNIMILDDKLYFIDYQGGRKGALQYDVASLLFESRVDLPAGLRDELLDFYLENLREKTGIQPGEFRKHYYGFVLIRILQAMGAYGIRGIVENKSLFLQSIPYAIRNIRWLRKNSLIPEAMPELSVCLDRICDLEEWEIEEQGKKLLVRINSFSYKNGLPRDLSGNGGGYVFDCRALPNPGREQKYRLLTGHDREVIEFLENKKEVKTFLERAFALVEQSIEEYSSRGFNNLMVSFGCTGGQHRSVYCAERLEEFIKNKFRVKTLLIHRELDN